MKKNKIILALSLATTFAISGCSEGDADDYVQRNLFAVGDIVEAVEDGGTVEGDVSLNDKGEGLTFSLESGSQMQNGTLEFNQDGTFNYTPNPDFNGTDSVTYIATQSGTGETDHATLTIKVINDFETLAEYGWQLSSEQSFDGETIDSEQWTASNANISDGQLILTAPVQSNAMAKSASIIRIDANTVGRIEAAVQIPEGKDVYSAFSLLPMADKYQGLNSIVMLEGNSGGLISGIAAMI